MGDLFAIVEEPLPVPAAVVTVDLTAELTKLYRRCGALENAAEAAQREQQNALQVLLLGLLEVADALDRILQQAVADLPPPALRQRRNIEATRRLLAKQLARAGVSALDLVGKPVDTTVADVEEIEENPALPNECVSRELQTGYRWQAGVLRRAKVVVIQNG